MNNLKQIKIEVTMDYDKFKFLDNNREVYTNKKHFKDLEKSMLTTGHIYSKPINVNDKFEIIDGQNRFMVCKKNNLPVYYIVTNLNKNDIYSLQIAKQWTSEDYLKSYCMQEKPCYLTIQNILKEHERINLAFILRFINSGSGATYDAYRNGSLTISGKELDKIYQGIELCKILFDKTKSEFIYYGYFVHAINTLINLPNFDFKTCKNKFSVYGHKLIRQADSKNTVKHLVEIYNMRNKNPLIIQYGKK